MAKKAVPETKTEQKVQTRYDRKMEARKQKEAKDKKDEKRFKILSTVVIALLAVGIIGGIAVSVINKQSALNGTYVKIGEEEVTKLEFDYYYNNVVNNYMTSYASILSYLGLDSTKDFDEQPYTDELSWKDMFDQMTVEQMSQTYALLADAEASGYTYDVTEEYNQRTEEMKAAAETAGMTVAAYYESMYGGYATEKNVEPFIKQDMLAGAYYNELLATNAPSDEEITAYYEAHKEEYDRVNYRSFTFTADVGEDASEEDINKAMDELKVKAEAFMAAREGGSDFEELCLENASEEEKANYEDTETEYSLSEGRFRSGVPAAIADWLYEDTRKEGDLTVIADEENHRYYVAEFIKKYYDETDDANISSFMASERVTEYVTTLMEDFKVTDEKGKLKYLTVDSSAEETDTEASETEAGESTEGTEEADTETTDAAETEADTTAE